MELATTKKKHDQQKTDNALIYGKLPPQAIELEKWVLGACMEQKEVIDTVIEILRPECFYSEPHQLIFSAMCGLQQKNMIVDIRSVVTELQKRGVLEYIGGPFYVTKLTNEVVHTHAAEQHSRIILEKFIQREIIRICGELISKGYEDTTDVFDLLDKAETGIFGITASFLKKDFVSAVQAAAKVVERVDNLRKNSGELTGVTSGFKSMDRVTYGWQDTDLIILAARPSMGKTALGLNLARNAAMNEVNPVGVGFFSLEMSCSQLAMRILSAESEIPMESISRGKLNDNQYTTFLGKGVRKFESAPIYIDDTAAINIMQFRAKARRMVNKHKVKLIIIDYLQLMSGTGENKGNREQEISTISRNLKATAKELNVPIIALSQLSRAVESRTGEKKMPQLSDLRECLPISEFVYTPEGVQRLSEKPSKIITCGESVEISSCDFIEKKYNTVYTVKTQFGQFKATANHLVLTGVGWKKVCDLSINRDVIASPKSIPHANKGYLPHGRLLGWLIGNGGLTGTPSLIYRKELDNEVKEAVSKFGVTVRYRKTQKSDNVYDTYLSNGVESGSLKNPLMEWIRELNMEGCTCYTKFIPKQYLGSSNETHIDLLRGLWESDGTVANGAAKYSTVSELLARQVSWLLLTIGVRSTVNFYNNIWEIRCSSSDNENMSIVVSNKQRFNDLSIPSDKYIDPAPSIFIELTDELISSTKTRMQKKQNGAFKSISKTRLKEVISQNRITTIEESPFMTMENMGWGRLYSVEKNTEEVRVCDLHVPFTHNFITNGIVVHNSGAIEQDADMVMFIYRPEYYEVMNNEQGESTHGETHVRIAKHRNGSLETIKLRAKLDIQKFEEWEETELPSSWKPIRSITESNSQFDDGFKTNEW